MSASDASLPNAPALPDPRSPDPRSPDPRSPNPRSPDPLAPVAASPDAISASDTALASDRFARLALNHAVEPADPLIGRLLVRHTPAEVLAAIHADQLADLDPDPSRRERLIDRCAGLKLRLEPGQVESGIASADAVGARFIVPADDDWPHQLNDLGELRPIGIWSIGHWPPNPPNGSPPTGEASRAMMSIVGARACTGYGAYIAGAIGADLATAQVAVVSGAAAIL